MPRFAEIEGGVVRFVLPPSLSSQYPVLVQGQVTIADNADVKVGDLYDGATFSRPTDAELKTKARPMFDSQRKALFAETQWVRERAADLKEMDRLGTRTLTAEDIATWKAWLVYWKALRDLPNQPDFDPRTPNWPIQPS